MSTKPASTDWLTGVGEPIALRTISVGPETKPISSVKLRTSRSPWVSIISTRAPNEYRRQGVREAGDRGDPDFGAANRGCVEQRRDQPPEAPEATRGAEQGDQGLGFGGRRHCPQLGDERCAFAAFRVEADSGGDEAVNPLEIRGAARFVRRLQHAGRILRSLGA